MQARPNDRWYDVRTHDRWPRSRCFREPRRHTNTKSGIHKYEYVYINTIKVRQWDRKNEIEKLRIREKYEWIEETYGKSRPKGIFCQGRMN